MTRSFVLSLLLATAVAVSGQDQSAQSARNEALFEAARAGDVARIATALEAGAEINGKARYNVTALFFAATNGHLDAVKALIARGADINVTDTFYNSGPAEMAISNGHRAVAVFLLERGANGADGFLVPSIQQNLMDVLRAAAAGTSTRTGLESAITLAERLKRDEALTILRAALATRPATPPVATVTIDPATYSRYVGTYRDAASGMALTISVQQIGLVAQPAGQPAFPMVAMSETEFRIAQVNATLTFTGTGTAPMESIALVQGPAKLTLVRGAAAAPAPPAAAGTATVGPATSPDRAFPAGPRHWPSFRGEAGAGNGDGQRAVTDWDVATGRNIKWKTPIPGISNSSPIVWGNRVFVATAITKGGDTSFRTGLYGDVAPINDLSEHEWKMYALDKATGQIVWERTAFTGAPKTKRHPKASQANSTPVTNGSRVVAVFGSIGQLIAWDFDGREQWRVDLGVLDSGWFFDPGVQWGHSSSPIIHGNAVILQADIQKASYIAAWDINTGKQLWKTMRPDEIPSWGTPVVLRGASGRDELVTNGTKIRGYDAATGALLWTLGPNSELTVGTPVVGHGKVFVTGGYPPVRPIYAVRPGASGDISLPKGSESSAAIAWSNMTEGTYIPSPLVYRGYLFTLNNNGVISAYNADTGQRAFRGRAGTGGAFSASLVVADGRLYVASEDGEVCVVNAAPGLEQVSRNDMGEVIMATPAISDGLIILRTIGHVYGIGS